MIGGSSELAEAVLARLANRGLTAVALCGRDLQAMHAVAARLEPLGISQAEVIACDVQHISVLADVAAEAVTRLGSIDLLLVAAGALAPPTLDELGPEVVAEVVGANFTGPAAAIVAFLPALRRQAGARLVVLSSVAGVRVRRANFAYGSSKAGLDAFARGLADALAGSGVEVLIVRPGFVRTKLTAGRPAQPLAVVPQQVGAAVVAALERHASVVYVPAVLRPVFGLARLVPRRAWRRLDR